MHKLEKGRGMESVRMMSRQLRKRGQIPPPARAEANHIHVGEVTLGCDVVSSDGNIGEVEVVGYISTVEYYDTG